MTYSNPTSKHARRTLICAAEWEAFQQLPEDQQDAWLDRKEAAEQMRKIVSARQFVSYLESGYVYNGRLSTGDDWDDLPPVREPENVEDYDLDPYTFREDAGPVIVDIREYRGDGPDAVEQIVSVEARSTWPPYRMVA